MHRNEEFLKKIFNLLFYLSEQDPEKLKLPRYPEAILDRTAHLLSGQCWNGWSWDHGLLLSHWICNPTTLLRAYSMKIKALHHWASQGFTKWAEFTETNIWKSSSSSITTRKHKRCHQEPSSNQRACLSNEKISRSLWYIASWCCWCKKRPCVQSRRLNKYSKDRSTENFQNRHKAHSAQEIQI